MTTSDGDSSSSPTSSKEFLVDFIAGWCSGAAAIILCQPVDTVLTRLQANTTILTRNAATATTAGLQGVGIGGSAIGNGAATATLEFQGLISKAGTTSLWRGSTPMVSAVPLQNALLMSGYGWGKRLSGGVDDEEGGSHNNNNEQDVNNQLLGVFVGGTTGGIIQSFLMVSERNTAISTLFSLIIFTKFIIISPLFFHHHDQ